MPHRAVLLLKYVFEYMFFLIAYDGAKLINPCSNNILCFLKEYFRLQSMNNLIAQ